MKKYLRIIIYLLGLISVLNAGTSGKISGVITDENGDELVGVNVFIEGTTIGSATDINGYYVLLNLSPGSYNLTAGYIGYTSVKVTDILVSMNLTTYNDIIMESETISSGEEVVVVAERSLLNQDEFSSKHILSAEDIDIQPATSIIEIAQNQAGAVGNNFRGGRSGEVLIVIDGIPIKNSSSGYTGDFGGFSIDVPKDAVQEMEVSLGGFSAEYGNVQSGVLNLAMKDGDQKFKGSFYSSTTNFGNLNKNLMPKDDWWKDAKYQQKLENDYQFSLSGPIGKIPHFLFQVISLTRSRDIFSIKNAPIRVIREKYLTEYRVMQGYPLVAITP